MSTPVTVSDTDSLAITDDVPVLIHQGSRHSRHEDTPGPAAPLPVPERAVRQVPQRRRTKRLRQEE